MGGVDNFLVGRLEPLVRYHSNNARILTLCRYPARGQFQVVRKGNGGVQRFPQAGRKSVVECKGIRELDCETYKSNKDESRP